MNEHRLNILLRTSEFRGDHNADVSIAYDYKGDETIDELVKEILLSPCDVIEIRICKERE